MIMGVAEIVERLKQLKTLLRLELEFRSEVFYVNLTHQRLVELQIRELEVRGPHIEVTYDARKNIDLADAACNVLAA